MQKSKKGHNSGMTSPTKKKKKKGPRNFHAHLEITQKIHILFYYISILIFSLKVYVANYRKRYGREINKDFFSIQSLFQYLWSITRAL